jgi:hypothetical protein
MTRELPAGNGPLFSKTVSYASQNIEGLAIGLKWPHGVFIEVLSEIVGKQSGMHARRQTMLL